MHATEHPFYIEEQKHLDDTYTLAEKRIEENSQSAKLEYEWSAAVAEKRDQIIKFIGSYKEILRQPYFGRVEWKPAGAKAAETFYVGLRAFPEMRVYSWRDSRNANTLIGDLYYSLGTQREAGTLLLKRSFEIDERELSAISDDFVHASLQAVLEKPLLQTRFTDSLLVQLLRESRAGQLREIVATIQQQQFEIIRRATEQTLLIQGAPGSGKTVIALHRVAYLLYNDERLRQQGALVLGPSPLYLHYTARVLPVLGEYHVPQLAFSEWIERQLDTTLKVESQEQALEFLFDANAPSAQKIMRLRNAQAKGSERMALLLENYVAYLYEAVWVGRQTLTVTIPSRLLANRAQPFVFTQSVEALRQRAAQLNLQTLPFNERRDTLIAQLMDVVEDQAQFQDDNKSKSEARTLAERQIRAYWEGWENANTVLDYRRLFRNPEILREVGRGVFTPDELELMALDAPKATVPFRFSDLAALMYLNILFQGVPNPYGFIVADEAQDLTPLHFKVLQRFSRSGALTLLGDLAQGVYGQQGVQTWGDVKKIWPNLQQETIRKSYRATQEITEFANALLRRAGVPDDQWPEVVERPGARPELHACGDLAAVAEKVISLIKRETTWQSFAIVAKSVPTCQRLATELRGRGFSDFELVTERESRYSGGVAIIPSYLTKGLEFDVVIVADADAETYPPDEFNLRLLYVSLTRAVHILHIIWVGRRSPWLDSQQTTVSKQAFLNISVNPSPVTIKAYADQHKLDPDWCIERLASTDRLWLLNQGRMDETLLEIILTTDQTNSRRVSPEVDDETLVTFGPETEREIRASLNEWDEQTNAELQKGLTLAQLAYGLFRPQLRNLRLLPPSGAENTLSDQVLALARFRHTLRSLGSSIPPGQWITKPQLIRAMAEHRQAWGQKIIQSLLQNGLLEELPSDPTRSRVRLSPDYAQGLLERSLGGAPVEWETDLLEAIPTVSAFAPLLAVKEV